MLDLTKYEAKDAKDNFERRIFSLSEPCTSGADLIIVVTAVMVASTCRVTLARFVVVETFITPGNRRVWSLQHNFITYVDFCTMSRILV